MKLHLLRGRNRLAEVLEESKRGEVSSRRAATLRGRPEVADRRSPFDVPGVAGNYAPGILARFANPQAAGNSRRARS